MQVLNPKMLTILHKSVMGGVHVKPEAPAAKPGKALHPVQPTLTSSQQHFLRRQVQLLLAFTAVLSVLWFLQSLGMRWQQYRKEIVQLN